MSQMIGGFGSGTPVSSTSKDGREIEAKSVNVHLRDPVSQTVQDHPAHNWLVSVEGVASATVVGVLAAVTFKNIVSLVFQPTETKTRPEMIALSRVIEDYIQNYFDTRPV